MTQTTTERLYSFEEYVTYDDGTDSRYELVDGKLERMNPPTFRHLLISDFIQDNFTALTAAMRYIPKSESFDRRGQGKKLYCIIAGSAVR